MLPVCFLCPILSKYSGMTNVSVFPENKHVTVYLVYARQIIRVHLTFVSNYKHNLSCSVTGYNLFSVLCPGLEYPQSGSVDVIGPQPVGTTANYNCSNGLISGNLQRECLSSGMWSGDPAVCHQGTVMSALKSISFVQLVCKPSKMYFYTDEMIIIDRGKID